MTVRPLLFRQQAVDAQRQRRQWGDVASLQPLSLKVTVWFLVMVMAAFAGFAAVAEYSQKETAIGYLSPTRGTAKIFVPRNGTIRAVHVAEGASVQEGQALLTIDTDLIAGDGSDVNAAVLDTLGAQLDQLVLTIAGEEQRGELEQERLKAAASGLEAEIGQLQDQLALQHERLTMADEEAAAGEELRGKGLMNAPDLRRRQLAQLEARQSLVAIGQQITAKQNQLTETTFALRQLPALMAQTLQSQRNEVAAIEQRIAEIKGRGAYVVRAPMAGRVAVLLAMEGQHADPQRLQLEIIPLDAVLHATLFMPARAIAFVETGQPVRILFDAFPYQHYGTHTARVTRVSHTILTGNEAGGPLSFDGPVYRIDASLERQEIDAYGKSVPLQPDMLLRADIILEPRSLLSWMINPLRSVRM
jgi:membrane fusion protein